MTTLSNFPESLHNSTKNRETQQQTLTESETRFSALVANIPGAVYRCCTDSGWTMTFLSEAIAEISGYQPDEFINNRVRSFRSIIHPQERRTIAQSIAESISTKQPYVIEYRIVRSDARIAWVYDKGQAIFGENGEILWLDGVILDITERKHIETQLQHTKAFLDSVVENLPMGVLIKDAKELQVMYWNKASEELFGYSREQVLGKNDYDFLPREQARYLRAKDRQVLTDGILVDIPEAPLATPHRGERLVYTKKVPLLDDNGTPQYLLAICEDITDRKRAEVALRESESHYRCIVETASEGVWTFDPDNQVTFANSRMAQMLGYTVEEMLGRSLFEFMDEENQALARSQMERRRQGIPERYDFKFRRKDGSDLWAMVSATAIFDSEGHFVGILRMITDISERKQAEAQLQEREQFLRSIYNGVENSICVVDVLEEKSDGRQAELPSPAYEFRYRDINPAHERLTGIPASQQRDKTPQEVLPAAVAATVSDRYRECVTTGTSISYEECLPLQGKDTWWITTLTPLRDQQGKIYRLVSTSTNITQRKQAEQETARLTDILEMTTDFVSTSDVTGRILYLNRAGRQWVGFEEDEDISTQKISDFCPSSVMELIQTEGLPTAVENGVWRGETALLNQTGQAIPVSQVIVAHKSRIGEVEFFSTINRDISERKRAEEALQKSERQLRANNDQLKQTLHQLQKTQTQLIQNEKMASLGQMIAGIAHEINNPIGFITGNITYARQYAADLLYLLQLYAKHYPEPVTEIQEEIEAIDLDFLKTDFLKLLQSMKEGADRIRQIILSLRNFSRLDEADIKEVDIHEGIDSTLLILQHRLKPGTKHPDIQVVKDYSKLPRVECYAGQLNQVFMNILSNAIDALEPQPTPRMITIRTAVENRDWVVIRIIDNGSGIPEDTQKLIFDPFFTTKPVGAGTGLGLSISHSVVVDKHGGRLTCTSLPGQGAEFAIALPVKQKGVSAQPTFSYAVQSPSFATSLEL
ncbi:MULTISPECIES: PAS domain S-box protein [unclassified Coleofasciculus]|uniref:PAS domain S-box protein n=1 Tax=unclassified Coleofasciculus TaxID=2692782 RepID=UPI00187EA9B3|nr:MULTISPECIES: PAS domain S-box protein [unclassified Coleofasciculus]MBE9127998.1 PAS domain S-box protein [Coleofasciculus sp. LEGE 07081]MBE9151120.1 PAS domain S-box protein [Coleofasciculus sp. LEGE 07092]